MDGYLDENLSRLPVEAMDGGIRCLLYNERP